MHSTSIAMATSPSNRSQLSVLLSDFVRGAEYLGHLVFLGEGPFLPQSTCLAGRRPALPWGGVWGEGREKWEVGEGVEV